MLLERLQRHGFQIEFRSHAEAILCVDRSNALPGADSCKAIRHLTFHSGLTAKLECGYCGETWAELNSVECGHIKWHSDGHTTSIDYIETNGIVPLLGARLLKAVWDYQKQQLDPGMMNEAGKRLWRLFCTRYSYD